MEKKSEEGLIEQPKYYEHLQYDPMETRNEGIVPASQRILQEPTSSIFTVARPPEYASTGVKPVLNYSIQTGEEFAFEFMRDRANPRKQFIPNAAGDQNTATGYMDLKGILGISHTGSESGSDVSMLATGEKKSVKDLDKKGSYESDNKSYYESARSVQRAASGGGSSRGFSHGYTSSGTSDGSLMKMKVLCSFGGKILPRPSDGKLRYVGGDTRIIRINKDISWQELMQKTSTIYNQAHTIKYQLPGEDLDALVSVSCDEDLQNMMEECNLLEGGEESQKLRMFLFSSSELDDAHFGLGSVDGDSETQYVVAVNGMDLGPRKGSSGHGLESTSGNGLDQLLTFNIGRDRQTVGTSSAPLPSIPVPPSNTLSNQIQGSSFNGYETHMKAYQDRMMDHLENERHPFSTAQPFDSFNDGRHKTFVPSSMPPQYNYSSQYAPSVESPLPMPLHELVSLRQEGLTEGKHSDGGFRVKDAEVPVKEVKLTTDSSTQPKNENEHLPHLEQYDSSVPNHRPSEVSFIPLAPESRASPMPPQHDEKRLEPVQGSMPTSAVNASQTHVSNDNDDYFTSAGSFASGTANSEVDSTEFNYYEPPLRPQRVFHSERIPREQAELQNRLSKSDDNISSQFPIPHSRSGLAQQEPITESVDPLHEDNPNSHAEQSILSAKEPQINPLTVEGGLMQFEKYKELADAINQMNQHGPDEHLNSAQISPVNDHLQEPSPEEADVFGSDNPSAGPDTAIKEQENPVSPPQELHWGDVTTNATSNNSIVTMGQAPPFAAWAVSSAGGVSRDESFVRDATPERGDILIDINDRFPPDLLSDLFSKARFPDDSTGISPLRHDDTGLSLNMQNPEPKRWSFFRNLAPDEFIRKDVSLMDQDHIGFPHPLAKIEEGTTKHYGFSPLELERAGLGHVESQIDFDEEIRQESSGMVGANTNAPHPDYIPSQVVTDLHLLDKDNEAVQADDISFSKLVGNVRTDSEYEEGKIEAGHIGGPIADPLLSEFDIIDLQIIKNEDLEELRELGSGTFGTVYHGKWRGTDVAIKRIKKSCFTGRSSEQERLTIEFWREAEILSRLHHPNVVAFYGVVQDGPGATLATVTEFMVNGSLRHVLLRKDKYLDRRKRLIIAMDAAFGMEYLHSKNIVHFDLKCDNLLVNLKDPMRPICKVGDFGLSKIKRNTLVTGGVRGTLPWMAPELLNGSSNKVSEKVDVFSFGIVMWEILTGEEPYANMHYGAIIGGIVSNTLRPPVPSSCDPEWRRLMEQCWAPDPTARPSFTEIASRLRFMSTATQTKPQGSGTKSGTQTVVP
ncbi:PB1 domain-containing protein/Pkinase_Tyr domain-containing protein [Cinnamomum micranthum f. kanehirae]|uniref:PB1 domain-containing protein/Pkinase_Tyr domain-containing protein n=1 Tax=Cinnamomum micranthum f. kanehirae TaxID=337451 RepID=A0A3S3MT86_9MAGN|nr:PB1 domain-containing protein/Pkinase_Tyr domain-containing protein [Cinnamomum micranthum f. kanehirae]